MNTWLKRAAFTLCLIASGPAVAQNADTTTVTFEQAQAIASNLLQSNQPAKAREVAITILRVKPDDVLSLVILARSELLLGRPKATEAAAKRAFALAAEDAPKYASASLVAEALAQQGAFTRSQIWLRRAAQHAPNDNAEARVANNYRKLRQLNPFSVNLSFSASPSSNVNGGTRSLEPIYIGGLPFIPAPASQALSGLEVSTGLSMRYRLSEDSKHRTELSFSGYARRVALSQEARDLAPGVRSSDYSYNVAEFGAKHSFRLGQRRGSMSVEGVVGRAWFGGETLADYGRATVGRQFHLSERMKGAIDGTFELRKMRDGSDDALRTWRVSGHVDQGLANRGLLRYTLGAERVTSNNDYREYDALRAGVTYVMPKPVLTSQISLTMGLEKRDYALAAFTDEGRHDKTVRLSARFAFPEADYYGFFPSVTVAASRTFSNLPRFEVDDLGVSLGLSSKF